MGDGDKRNPKRSVKYDSRELAKLSKKHVATEAEWDAKVAARALTAVDPASAARTTTLDDPFTTSLLAEIARRSKTIDVAPEQIDEVHDIEPGNAGEPGDPDQPVDPA